MPGKTTLEDLKASIQDVPGTMTVNLRPADSSDRGAQTAVQKKMGEAVKSTPSSIISLASLRQELGGDEGEITDPMFGKKHRVSLKQWSHLAPDTEFVMEFIFKPDINTPAGGTFIAERNKLLEELKKSR